MLVQQDWKGFQFYLPLDTGVKKQWYVGIEFYKIIRNSINNPTLKYAQNWDDGGEYPTLPPSTWKIFSSFFKVSADFVHRLKINQSLFGQINKSVFVFKYYAHKTQLIEIFQISFCRLPTNCASNTFRIALSRYPGLNRMTVWLAIGAWMRTNYWIGKSNIYFKTLLLDSN